MALDTRVVGKGLKCLPWGYRLVVVLLLIAVGAEQLKESLDIMSVILLRACRRFVPIKGHQQQWLLGHPLLPPPFPDSIRSGAGRRRTPRANPLWPTGICPRLMGASGRSF